MGGKPWLVCSCSYCRPYNEPGWLAHACIVGGGIAVWFHWRRTHGSSCGARSLELGRSVGARIPGRTGCRMRDGDVGVLTQRAWWAWQRRVASHGGGSCVEAGRNAHMPRAKPRPSADACCQGGQLGRVHTCRGLASTRMATVAPASVRRLPFHSPVRRASRPDRLPPAVHMACCTPNLAGSTCTPQFPPPGASPLAQPRAVPAASGHHRRIPHHITSPGCTTDGRNLCTHAPSAAPAAACHHRSHGSSGWNSPYPALWERDRGADAVGGVSVVHALLLACVLRQDFR